MLFCSAAVSLSSKVKRRHRTAAHRRKSSKKISSSLHASCTVDERILHGSLSLSCRFGIKSIDVRACVRGVGGCHCGWRVQGTSLMKAILSGKFTFCTGIFATNIIHTCCILYRAIASFLHSIFTFKTIQRL